MNFIFGSAGFAKEVDWMLEDIYNIQGLDFRTDFFVAENENIMVGNFINNKKVISEEEFFFNYADKQNNCFVAVGKPEIREKIVTTIREVSSCSSFPNLIHPSACFDKRPDKVKLGEGNIICTNATITTDVIINDFTLIYLNCTVAHDSEVGSFSTLSPGVHVSGNVKLADKVFFGTGAVVIEKINICSGAVIGAGAVVVRNITEPGTYVGNPARKLK